MPYQTGSANSAADLLTALQGFCTANGWTLAGSVLSKGACYTKLTVSGNGLSVLGGTGVDGSNALTGAGPAAVSFDSPRTAEALVYPLTYAFHAADTEVYAVLNWSVTAYTVLGFGASPVPGLPGTGGWYAGSFGGPAASSLLWRDANNYYLGQGDSPGRNATGLFWSSDGNITPVGGYVHHGLDGGSWSASTSNGGASSFTVPTACAKAAGYAGPLLVRQPNLWNAEAALVPVQVYIDRGSSKHSVIASLLDARYVNMANLAPGDIITLGSDRWLVYPFFRKGAVQAPSGSDSGYLGVALRYDGP